MLIAFSHIFVIIYYGRIDLVDNVLEEIKIKFYIYQIIAILIIWTGMTFFIGDLDPLAKQIYYVVTGWLLLLILLCVKKYIRDKKGEDSSQNEEDKK